MTSYDPSSGPAPTELDDKRIQAGTEGTVASETPKIYPADYPEELKGQPATGGGTGTGGGGTGGGTGDGGTSVPDTGAGSGYGGPGKDYNDADGAARFFGIGGHPEVWKDSATGQTFIVYFQNMTDPPIPLLYEVSGVTTDEGAEHTLEAFFGPGNEIVFDRELDTSEITSTGAVKIGVTNNLIASEGDPWMGFKDRMERYAEVSPFANDPEILGLLGGAYLEGRELAPWELNTTDWWRDHNPAERKWLEKSMMDPAAAAQELEDNSIKVASMFDSIGADGTDPALIDWLTNKWTSGAWSEFELADQVEAVTSGWNDVDPDLAAWLDSSETVTASSLDQHEKVRELYNTWLGPAFAPTDEDIGAWATRMRNSADGEEELVAMLRGQRLAQYPEYEDPNLTYQQIAGTWKNLGFQVWGQKMDETSDTFQEMLHANDYSEANRILRRDGLKQDNEKVWADATKQFHGDQSTNVRRAV